MPHHISVGGLKRSFWVGMTLVGCGLLLWNLSSVFMIYMRYPVDVKITITNKRELMFPAVTVCNMNPIKASALEVSIIANILLQYSENQSKSKYDNIDI